MASLQNPKCCYYPFSWVCAMPKTRSLEKDLRFWRKQNLERLGYSPEVIDWTFESLFSSLDESGESLNEASANEIINRLKNQLIILGKQGRPTLPDKEVSPKLQVSVPPSLATLLSGWAACEGRDVSSVVLQAVEVGVHQLRSDGRIPEPALNAYSRACQARHLIAELHVFAHSQEELSE